MRCLGLDLGSTTIKGAVLDLGMANLSHFHSEPFPGPNLNQLALGHEVSLEKVMAATQAVLARLIQTEPEANDLFICSQMGGLVISNSRGIPYSPYLSWRDQRSLSEFSKGSSFLAEAEKRIGQKGLSNLGNELKAGTASTLLFWLDQNGLVPKGAVASSLGEWVVAQLANKPISMHSSMAIGWLDLANDDWGYESFELLGLGKIKFPTLMRHISPIGNIQIGGRTLRIYPALGDQQCALFGTNLDDGELSVNASTGSQVSRLRSNFLPGPYQSRFYFDGKILDTITHIPAGRSLNAIIDFLTEISRANGCTLDPWDYIKNELKHTENAPPHGSNGLECGLSFFPGPLGEKGYLSGITLENLSVRNLMVAAIESMAKGYRFCSEKLGPAHKWGGIVLSGGLAHSLPTLRERIGSLFEGIAIRETPGKEETLMGLLRIARKKLGLTKTNTEIDNLETI